MNRPRMRSVLALVTLSLIIASCAGEAPTGPMIDVSVGRVPAKGWLVMTGRGFTPNQNVTSHLLQPDGREFPELPIMTDSEGRFTHDIDTLLLLVGTHELWVVDDTAGVSTVAVGVVKLSLSGSSGEKIVVKK